MDRLLTVRDLAERLRVTSTCVYRWLAENRLPAIRLSRRCVRFRESDVHELLEQLANKSGTGKTGNQAMTNKGKLSFR